MGLSVGIVGLPNVGKSTLFNALLKKQAALAANYPFATIEPNVGIVPVPDRRLSQLAEIIAKENQGKLPPIKPATVEFVDIAGLVKGASRGEGLGNQFLSHIREVNLICHVIRDFSDKNVIREGSVDVKTDLATIQMELLLADLQTLEKQKPPKASKDRDILARWSAVEKFLAAAQAGRPISEMVETDLDQRVAKELNLLTAKTNLYVINVDEEKLAEGEKTVRDYSRLLEAPPKQILLVSAKIESELSLLEPDEQQLFLQELGQRESGLERLISRAYQQLRLQSFLTAGEKEVRAWTIAQGTLAPAAAGTIHSDFAKNFIKAKVADFADFIRYQGWRGLREAGKIRLEGKDYPMRDGDVVEFMIGG